MNDFIDKAFSSAQYATFDYAIAQVLKLGNCLLAKMDLDSAFRLIPVHPDDHNLLGFQLNKQFYYDCTLPMEASSFCQILARFSRNLEWVARTKLKVQHMVHILDDFLFLGPPNSPLCNTYLDNFIK